MLYNPNATTTTATTCCSGNVCWCGTCNWYNWYPIAITDETTKKNAVRREHRASAVAIEPISDARPDWAFFETSRHVKFGREIRHRGTFRNFHK